MYRYVAFIHPPKSTDPVSHASPHIFVFVFISFFLFVLLHGKIETATVPVKRSLESRLEIDRAIYTVGGCIIVITNDKLRQTTCFFSSYVVCISKKKRKKKRNRHPILSYRPRADFG